MPLDIINKPIPIGFINNLILIQPLLMLMGKGWLREREEKVLIISKLFIEYTPEIYTVRITPTFIDLVLNSDEPNTIYSYF